MLPVRISGDRDHGNVYSFRTREHGHVHGRRRGTTGCAPLCGADGPSGGRRDACRPVAYGAWSSRGCGVPGSGVGGGAGTTGCPVYERIDGSVLRLKRAEIPFGNGVRRSIVGCKRYANLERSMRSGPLFRGSSPMGGNSSALCDVSPSSPEFETAAPAIYVFHEVATGAVTMHARRWSSGRTSVTRSCRTGPFRFAQR